MANHHSRNGAISAQLFVAILDEMQSTHCPETPDTVSVNYLRHRIMDAALRIAIQRAALKWGWECMPTGVEVDLAGYVHNPHGIFGLNENELTWIQTEIKKISRKALAALENPHG